MTSKIITYTLPNNRVLKSGDEVHILVSRWFELKKLFTKPRITFITDVTPTTLTLLDRKMSWTEWFKEVWYYITP